MSALITLLVALFVMLAAAALVYWRAAIDIADDEIGLINKKYDLRPFGAKRASSGGQRVVLNGEPGWQADTLPPGRYFGYWPWLYEVEKVKRIHVPEGEIGLVFAKEGVAPEPGRILCRAVECDNFRDARAFLTNGGQQGRQIAFLQEGDHPINTKLFDVITTENLDPNTTKLDPKLLRTTVIEVGQVGVITTFDGQSVPTSGIGPLIAGHSFFQNGQLFIDRGGCKGLQEETLGPSEYKLNPWFARVELVPTYRISLDWSDDKKPETNYDAQLKALRISTKDGHEIKITITQIISIRAEEAPKMILRVGSSSASGSESIISTPSGELKYLAVRRLVSKELAPLIESYFREAALGYQAREYFESFGERAREAAEYIGNALSVYGVQADETAIKHIDLPDEIDKQIRRRKDAEMQIIALEKESELAALRESYENQRRLDRVRYDMEIRKLEADTKAIIEERQAQSRVEIARLQAEVTRLQHQLEQEHLNTVETTHIDVDVQRIRAVGQAQSEALEHQIDAIGGPDAHREIELVKAIAQQNVPHVEVGSSSRLFDAVLATRLGRQSPPQSASKQIPSDQIVEATVLKQEDDSAIKAALDRLIQISKKPGLTDDEFRQAFTAVLTEFDVTPLLPGPMSNDSDPLGAKPTELVPSQRRTRRK